jgi:hypothetical protein
VLARIDAVGLARLHALAVDLEHRASAAAGDGHGDRRELLLGLLARLRGGGAHARAHVFRRVDRVEHARGLARLVGREQRAREVELVLRVRRHDARLAERVGGGVPLPLASERLALLPGGFRVRIVVACGARRSLDEARSRQRRRDGDEHGSPTGATTARHRSDATSEHGLFLAENARVFGRRQIRRARRARRRALGPEATIDDFGSKKAAIEASSSWIPTGLCVSLAPGRRRNSVQARRKDTWQRRRPRRRSRVGSRPR